MVKQKLQAEGKETVSTRSEKSECREENCSRHKRIVAVNGNKFDQDVSDDGKE